MTEKLLELGRDAIGNIMHTLCREWVGSLSAGVARKITGSFQKMIDDLKGKSSATITCLMVDLTCFQENPAADVAGADAHFIAGLEHRKSMAEKISEDMFKELERDFRLDFTSFTVLDPKHR
jgi:hypothetical protein